MQIQFDAQFKTLKSDRDALSDAASARQREIEKLAGQLATLTGVEKQRDELTAELERIRNNRKGIDQRKQLAVSDIREAEHRANEMKALSVVSTEDLTNTIWRLTFNPDLGNASVAVGRPRSIRRCA